MTKKAWDLNAVPQCARYPAGGAEEFGEVWLAHFHPFVDRMIERFAAVLAQDKRSQTGDEA